jgi:type IV pilus assembly protein PilA
MRLAEGSDNSITNKRGFTLMELMVAVSIVAILATIAMPSFLAQRQRNDVAKALRMADGIRDDVTGYYNNKLAFPADNSEAGVPEPEFLIGNKVTSIQVEDGAIHITLGNKASKPLHDKTISMRPAIVTGSPASPISWLCGFDEPVPGMEAAGKNKTDIDDGLVPSSCGSQKNH